MISSKFQVPASIMSFKIKRAAFSVGNRHVQKTTDDTLCIMETTFRDTNRNLNSTFYKIKQVFESYY